MLGGQNPALGLDGRERFMAQVVIGSISQSFYSLFKHCQDLESKHSQQEPMEPAHIHTVHRGPGDLSGPGRSLRTSSSYRGNDYQHGARELWVFRVARDDLLGKERHCR